MRFAIAALSILAAMLLPTAALAWNLDRGGEIVGNPTDFNFERKTIRFDDGRTIESRDLSLPSKQRFLLSPVFLDSYPDSFPPEKQALLIRAIAAPTLALLLGFWIAGVLIAGKVSPFRALIAFPGSWIIGMMFVVFYLFFAARFGGGTKTVLVGAGIGAGLLSVFVSAVYSCSVFRGFLVFLVQIFAAIFLIVVTLAVTQATIDEKVLDRFWDERVFEPVGMLPASKT